MNGIDSLNFNLNASKMEGENSLVEEPAPTEEQAPIDSLTADSEANPEIIQDSPPQTEQEVENQNLQDSHENAYKEQVKKRRAAMHSQLTEKTTQKLSYYTNTEKENRVLDYVENFNRQYQLLFPHRKPLLLNMPNEYKEYKVLHYFSH